jgi:hypothetical protein
MSFPLDNLPYVHLGSQGDPGARTEVYIGGRIGGTVNEHLVSLQNAHRNWTNGNRAILADVCSIGGIWNDSDEPQVIYSFDNTAGMTDTIFTEVLRVILPRAKDRTEFLLIYDAEGLEIQSIVVEAVSGSGVSSNTTAIGPGLGRGVGSLGVDDTTALATLTVLIVNVSVIAGEVGKLYLLRLYEEETAA